MTERSARVLRALTIVVCAAAVILGGRMLYELLTAESAVEVVEPRQGEMDVERAIGVAGPEPVAVRGYVFEGPGGLGLRLCNGIQKGDPPRCLGPFLDLYQVNRASFDLVEGESDDGPVFHPKGRAVTIRGVIVGTAMTVQQVLQ